MPTLLDWLISRLLARPAFREGVLRVIDDEEKRRRNIEDFWRRQG